MAEKPDSTRDAGFDLERAETNLYNTHEILDHNDDKSPGVARIEAITTMFKKWHLYMLFVGIFFVAYAYGLDGTLRYVYQNIALADMGFNGQISTVAVVRAIVAAAAQPAFAKISDYFGRISILVLSVVFYLVGTVVITAATNVATFSGGSVLYQFGYTGVMLLVEVIIADTTSLRNRLFFSYIPAVPFLINAWVSGNIATATTEATTWQWAIGMWAIIFPVCCIPLFASLVAAEIRAKKAGLLKNLPSPYRDMLRGSLWVDFFWKADVAGCLLLAVALALILLPFTLAGGAKSIWGTARVIAPLVVGFVVALPLFIFWEMKLARYPLLPFKLLKNRSVLCALGIAVMLNTCWYTQGDYLYNTLVVSFGKSVTEATRVANIYSFVSTLIGLTLGLVARYLRRVKWLIFTGACLFVLAFGLLIRFRGGHSTSDFVGIVAAEVVLGIAGGFLPYTTQVTIQSAVKHERTAIITALYLSFYQIGSALGNTIAGGIWTNTLPKHILDNMNAAGVANSTALSLDAYADPYTFIAANPIGTPARDALDAAYREVQRYLCITGICLSAILVFLSLGLDNPPLGDKQSLDDAEKNSIASRDTEESYNGQPPVQNAESRL